MKTAKYYLPLNIQGWKLIPFSVCKESRLIKTWSVFAWLSEVIVGELSVDLYNHLTS